MTIKTKSKHKNEELQTAAVAVAVDHVVLTDVEIELFIIDTLASLLVRYDPKFYKQTSTIRMDQIREVCIESESGQMTKANKNLSMR